MAEPLSLLVLGGARSGKSRYAQRRAEVTGDRRLFVATAQPFDAEMADRIRRHRADRGEGWETIEAPIDLPRVIVRERSPDRVLLVDCLTLWASNLLLGDHDAEGATDRLVAAIAAGAGPIVLVANEVGLGIVPDNALARRFRDLAGTVNQRVADVVAEVRFLVAGLPMRFK